MEKYIKKRTLSQSFRNAFNGIVFAFKTQLSLKIHFLALICVIFLAFYLDSSYYEWLILLTVITGVITLELVNTSLEQTTDAVTDEYNLFIKRAKDTSSAAVLIYAIYALIIAALIFGPKINLMLTQ